MMLVGRGGFRIAESIAATTGVSLNEVMRPDFQRWLGGFADVEENVRRSVGLLRNHPYLPDTVDVIGLLYDNESGVVRSVEAAPRRQEARVAAPVPASLA